MTSRELYERHLAEMADGTPLRKSSERVLVGMATASEIIAVARWELWEAIYSLPPDPANGEPRGRHLDGWHASACAARAEGMLRQLSRLLETEHASAPARLTDKES